MSDFALAVARALMAAIFIIGGYNKLMGIAGFTGYLTKLGVPSPQAMAWAAGIFELVAGILFLVGFKTRLAALALFLFTGATIVLAHRFWITPSEMTQALKNFAMMGGFLAFAVYGGGRISLDRR